MKIPGPELLTKIPKLADAAKHLGGLKKNIGKGLAKAPKALAAGINAAKKAKNAVGPKLKALKGVVVAKIPKNADRAFETPRNSRRER